MAGRLGLGIRLGSAGRSLLHLALLILLLLLRILEGRLVLAVELNHESASLSLALDFLAGTVIPDPAVVTELVDQACKALVMLRDELRTDRFSKFMFDSSSTISSAAECLFSFTSAL